MKSQLHQVNGAAYATNLIDSCSVILTKGKHTVTTFFVSLMLMTCAGISISTAQTTIADQSSADFSQGTLGGNTTISNDNDGEIILQSDVSEEFTSTTSLGSTTWSSGGSATVSGGMLSVDGAHAYTATASSPGSSVEFVATFQAANFQYIGFAASSDVDAPWINIGEGGSSDGVYARTDDAGSVLLGADLLGSPHRYRIDWNASVFVFYVDGVQMTSISKTVSSNMIALISDFNPGGGLVEVDWFRVTPYVSSGDFTSRIFDQGGPTNWGTATWTSDEPSGSALSIFGRTGNTSTPDGSWSSFHQLTNGGSVGENAQYIQYKAHLTTSDSRVTPVLKDLTIEYTSGSDVTPPIISNVVAAPSGDGLSSLITWTTNEAANSLVEYGTNANSLNLSSSDPAFIVSHSQNLTGLSPGTTYYYRVTSEDASLNSTTEPITSNSPLSFTTPAPPCLVDDTYDDFNEGVTSNTYLSNVTDGEVILQPALATEFLSLPPTEEWQSFPWTGGTSTVNNGILTVDGARFNAEPDFGVGTSIEFVATFGNENFQHIGLGGGTDATGSGGIFTGESAWAMFSTGNNSSTLKARTFDGSTSVNFDLGGSYINSSHDYRIDWNETSIDYYIDGILVHSEPATITGTMRPAISDFNFGDASIAVDWFRVTPYSSSGTFTSRIYDGGGQRNWLVASWNANTPSGTSLSLATRSGNTPTPDGTWTTFTSITNGGTVGTTSQYIQYRASLSTTDTKVTPALNDFQITCSVNNDVAPTVSTQPASQTVCEGDEVSFISAADGTPAPTVQWQNSTDNGGSWNDILNATSPSLTFTATVGDDRNQYHAVWTNNAGSTTTSAATLAVTPLSTYYADGDSDGYGAGAAIHACEQPEETSTVNGDCNDADPEIHPGGTEICNGVDDNCNTEIDEGLEPTTILTQPASQEVCPGSPVTFSVIASGTNLTYQWKKGNAIIAPATNSSYTINSANAGSVGNYRVVVTGACGSTTSSIAALSITPAPVINTQPASQTVCTGEPVTFTVNASGTGLTYQWKKGNSKINGATNNSYSIASVASNNAANYSVIIKNSCGSSVASSAATLAVNPSPALSFSVAKATCTDGADGAIDLTVTGVSGTLIYLWSNGAISQDISGLTPAFYSVTVTVQSTGCSKTSGTTVGHSCPKPASVTINNITSTSAVVNWNSISCAVNYRVRYRLSSSATWIYLPLTATNSQNLTSLSSGSQYVAQTETFCGSNDSSGYTPKSSFTTVGTCNNATDLTTSDVTSTSATLNWVPNGTPTTWTIQYRKASTAGWTTVPNISGALTSKAITGLTPNTSYLWRIRAKCGSVTTPYSGNVGFTTLTSRLGEENSTEESAELLLYPNPNNGQFMVNMHFSREINSTAKIEVINLVGQTVLADYAGIIDGELSKEITLNKSTPAGMYFVRVTMDDQVYNGVINYLP